MAFSLRLALAATLVVSGCASATSQPFTTTGSPPRTTSAPTTSASTTNRSPTSSNHSTSGTSGTSGTSADDDQDRDADARIHELTEQLGSGGVSLEALDVRTGATFRYGATGGMLSASIAKLYILETLLLQHQQADDPLDDDDRDQATQMIENSDNDAANDLYEEIGEGSGLERAAVALGVRHTVPGPGILWGFNRTNASDYIALLHDIIAPGALDPPAQAFARHLMSNVEADQRWGVSAAADPGTVTEQKNGWLAADPDDGRWAVNSVGIITADQQPVLVAVLTQHGSSFSGGISVVEQLSKIAVHSVLGG